MTLKLKIRNLKFSFRVRGNLSEQPNHKESPAVQQFLFVVLYSSSSSACHLIIPWTFQEFYLCFPFIFINFFLTLFLFHFSTSPRLFFFRFFDLLPVTGEHSDLCRYFFLLMNQTDEAGLSLSHCVNQSNAEKSTSRANRQNFCSGVSVSAASQNYQKTNASELFRLYTCCCLVYLGRSSSARWIQWMMTKNQVAD